MLETVGWGTDLSGSGFLVASDVCWVRCDTSLLENMRLRRSLTDDRSVALSACLADNVSAGTGPLPFCASSRGDEMASTDLSDEAWDAEGDELLALAVLAMASD